MNHLAEGARQLPPRHLSVRVPWNDTNWSGRVCRSPADNTSCLILPRIREMRDDEKETALSGRLWSEIAETQLPPCVSEHGGFMAPYPLIRHLAHPYSKSSKAHEHFLPTPFRYPAYSAASLPFAWMLAEEAEKKVALLELGFRPELEAEAHTAMGFETAWVQTKMNQMVMLDTFFSAIQPQRSLCFFYAKRTPFVDDTRRVLIGVGWATYVGEAVEYRYSESRLHTSVLWERSVQHSIRPDFKNGFLLPYHETLDYLAAHPELDPAEYVAFAPDEHFWSFSYGSEHVTNDGAIASLLSCAKALRQIQPLVHGQWDGVQTWIDARLNELWKMRGPCPGLGAALTAFGVQQGALLAYELERLLNGRDNLDPWPLLDTLFRDPARQEPTLRRYISPTLSQKWKVLPEERRALLMLLSRFELTNAQATRYYVHEDKQRSLLRLDVVDSQILKNPYLLYELDRAAPDPISQAIVDRGLFAPEVIRAQYPLTHPSRVDDATDKRRVRSFVVRQLELAAAQGNTLQERSQIIREIRTLEVQPPCLVDGDLMNVVEPFFSGVIQQASLASDRPAYQLERLHKVSELIRQIVRKRMVGRRHAAVINWQKHLEDLFGEPVEEEVADEVTARFEKARALEELYASRFSVLIGPAGTGKTTLLRVLCQEPSVRNGGVLLLAPTGKARVRLEEQTGPQGAKTIAQFLLPLDRYDPQTRAYLQTWAGVVDWGEASEV